MQDMLLCHLFAPDRLRIIERTLTEHGLATNDPLFGNIAWLVRHSDAAAISEAERALPSIIDQLEVC